MPHRFNILKGYNRRYLWRIFKIECRYKSKRFRLRLAHQIINFAFLISPDIKRAIEARMI